MNYRTKRISKKDYMRAQWGPINEMMPWYIDHATMHINLYGAPTPYEEMYPKNILRLSLGQGKVLYSRHVEFHLGTYKEVLSNRKVHNRTHKTFVVIETDVGTALVTTELLPCPKRKTIPLIMMNVTMAKNDLVRDNFIHYATSL